MLKHQAILLMLLFVGLPLPGRADTAPAKVQIGDPLVDGARLAPYTNQWKMHITTKDGIDIPDGGIWKDKLELVQYGGRQCWKRTQEATFKKQDGSIAGTNLTINIFDLKTMAPLYREFDGTRPGQPNKSTRITYSAGGMSIEDTDGDKTNTRVAKVGPAFDYDGGLYAVLWSAFPLKPGFSASFPSYSEGQAPETLNWHSFKVTGTETIQEPGLGKVDALVVEGDSESGPLKYWLIPRAPFVLRMDYTALNGTHWLLDMV